jgi:hypothetical protein
MSATSGSHQLRVLCQHPPRSSRIVAAGHQPRVNRTAADLTASWGDTGILRLFAGRLLLPLLLRLMYSCKLRWAETPR